MIDELNKLNISYDLDFDLTNYNTMKLISKCYMMMHPNNVDELKSVISVIKKYKYKHIVLGNGSNIILPKYYDGIVIKLDKFNKMNINDRNIYVESGYMINKLASEVSSLGYTGLEWATGIPGTVGGAIYSNAEAYKCPISDIVKYVTIFDGNNIKTFSNKDVKFEYRSSIFRHKKNLIILSCNIEVNKGDADTIKELIAERTKRRMDTQPLTVPSCGSVFRNPENAFAGKLIEDLGYKGYKVGGAKVSDKHANFIINDGNSNGEDVIKLINKIKKDVKKTYNINLILEQEIVK